MNNGNHNHVLGAVAATVVEREDGAAPTGRYSRSEKDFSDLLKRLREGISRKEVKQCEGWRDHNGWGHIVDYVEWRAVADLLDRLVPRWSHRVRRIVQIGDFVAATAAITINGVTREGIGVGAADSETGIKKAECDALKHAAVKFGVARDLYRENEKSGEQADQTDEYYDLSARTFDPLAKTREDLISPKQLSLIQSLAKRLRLDPEVICQDTYKAGLGEISRRAASRLIEHLQTKLPLLP